MNDSVPSGGLTSNKMSKQINFVLKQVVLKTFHSTMSLLFRKHFVFISISAIFFQYITSSPAQPRMEFWMKVIYLTVQGGCAFLVVLNWRLLFRILRTLPRDIRGAWRFICLLRSINDADRKNLTVAKVLDSYASKYPEKACFYFEDTVWTFKQVREMSNQIGNYFALQNFTKGDVIALLFEGDPIYVVIWLGLSKIGVCASLVNCNLRGQSLLHSFNVVNAKAIIYGKELEKAIEELGDAVCNSQRRLFCYGSSGVETLSLSRITNLKVEIENSSRMPPKGMENVKLHDDLFYIYTSGTTGGLPKAVAIKQHRFLMAANGVHFLNAVREQDILYVPLPLYHMTGCMVGVGQALLFGTSVVIRKRFSASEFWEDCIRYKVTVALYLGETCRYLLAQPPSSNDARHSVRLFCGNGLRQEIWRDFIERFNIKEIGEVYGSTEGNCNISNIDSKEGAVGFVPLMFSAFFPMRLIKIDEKTGDPVRDPKTGLAVTCQPNEPGELVGKIISQHPIRDFQGYAADPASSNKKRISDVFDLGDQAFRTGDILVMDDLGYYYFRDRTGDTFRWKGENVSTTEVESVISAGCSYQQVAVYGVKVPQTEGRAGMVAIEDPLGSIPLDTLSNVITKSLPSYARPLFLRVMDEMDMTGTHKMKKAGLQKEGYDVQIIKDKLYFLLGEGFVPLTLELMTKINSGKVRL